MVYFCEFELYIMLISGEQGCSKKKSKPQIQHFFFINEAHFSSFFCHIGVDPQISFSRMCCIENYLKMILK